MTRLSDFGSKKMTGLEVSTELWFGRSGRMIGSGRGEKMSGVFFRPVLMFSPGQVLLFTSVNKALAPAPLQIASKCSSTMHQSDVVWCGVRGCVAATLRGTGVSRRTRTFAMYRLRKQMRRLLVQSSSVSLFDQSRVLVPARRDGGKQHQHRLPRCDFWVCVETWLCTASKLKRQFFCHLNPMSSNRSPSSPPPASSPCTHAVDVNARGQTNGAGCGPGRYRILTAVSSFSPSKELSTR